MMTIGRLPRLVDIVWPSAFSIVAVVFLIGLGFWQLDRKTWKEQLIDQVDQRAKGDLTDLPQRSNWPDLNQQDDEFRRVAIKGRFLPGEEALVYTAGSGLRADVVGHGYWVFAPLHLLEGGIVVVNRGYIPEDRRDPASRGEGRPENLLRLIGVLRWPEPRGWFTPPDDPVHNLWFVRDPQSIATLKQWGEIAPFYIDLESPLPSGGFPKSGQIRVQLRNDHLQYAITWFGLAAIFSIIFAIWLSRQIRRPSQK
jgi:surfeit locus 1 family protein